MTIAQTPLLLAPKPFAPDVVRGHLLHGQTVAQGLTAAVRNGVLTLDDVPLVRVYVMGEPLPWADALDYVPEDGEVVTIVVEPQGGNTGKTVFQLFYTIGAAVVGFYFGPWAAAAVQIAGTLATNLIWRPDRDSMPSGTGRNALQDSGNRARMREMMPLILGRRRVEWDLAALPFTQNVGSEVWLTVAFAGHYGPLDVSEEKLGETLLADYPAADYQIERFLTPGPRNSQLYPSRVVQQNLQDKLDFTGGGVWEVYTAADKAQRIEVDITLPNGLKFNSPNSGKVRTEQVSVRIEYAPVGTENWVLAPGGQYTLDLKTNDAVRRTTGWAPANPALQYKVRTKAWDPQFEYPDEDGKTWDTYWTALRSIYRQPAFLDENLAIIVLRVKSSDDLNGNLPVFSAVGEPICEVFDSGTGDWGDPQPTSNAAAITRWLFTGPAPAEPLEANEINSSFGDQYTLIEERGWQGGIDVRDDTTQEDALLALGRMGRFSTQWNGEQLCLIPDWEKPIARQLFTGRNVEGYAYTRNLPDPIHAVLVEFRNSDADDRGDEIWVYADGYTAETADVFLTTRIDFACTKERAYREGRVFLAKYELQVETHEWTAGADAVVASFGDRVRVRHSVGLIGQAEARVQFRRWQGGVVGGLVTGVRLDTPVTMEPGKSYGIDCRLGEEDPDAGMLLDVAVTTQPGVTRDLVFPAPLSPSEAPARGDLVAFGEQGLVTEDLEVLDVKPNGDSARFFAQRYLAVEIEEAETGPIPDLPTTLQPRLQAPAPRFIGTAVGDPTGVQIAFDIDPARADQVAAFAPRWRRLSDEGPGDWASLPLLPPTARQVITPALPDSVVQPSDGDPDYVVQIDLRTVMVSRDISQRVETDPIQIVRNILPPTGVTAVGATRTDTSGASYPVLYITADPLQAGDIQDLVVEVRPTGSGDAGWRAAGQPLPAANPRGDMPNVQGGGLVDVRARWRTATNWVSPWVQTGTPVSIPNTRVASDTINVGGVPSGTVAGNAGQVPGLVTTLAGVQATVATHQATLYTATTGLVDRVSALFPAVFDPTTGLSYRMGQAETAIVTNNSAAVTRLNALETTVNTPVTGLSALVAGQQTAIVNLQTGKAEASTVTLLQARADAADLRLRPNANLLLNPSGADALNSWLPSATMGWSAEKNTARGDWIKRPFPSAAGLTASIFSANFGATAGQQYTLSTYYLLQGRTAGSTFFQVDCLNAGGGIVAGGSFARGVGNGEGEITPLTFTAPTGTTQMRVSAQLGGVSGDATALFAFYRMKLERGAVATPFSDETTLTQEAAGRRALSSSVSTLDTAVTNLQTGKADASRVVVLEARAYGPNVLPKAIWSGAETSLSPYVLGTVVAGVTMTPTAPGNHGVPYEGTLRVRQTGAPVAGGNFILTGDHYLVLPVEAGKRYCLSAYTAAQGCYAAVTFYMQDAAGAYIAGSDSTVAGNANFNLAEKTGSIPSNINALKRVFTFGVAPAGAASAVVIFRKFNSLAGQTDTSVFWSRYMFGEVSATATEPPPWADAAASASITEIKAVQASFEGRVESRALLQVTAGNQVTGMQFLAVDGPDASYSTMDFWAGVFRVSNNGATGSAVAPFVIRDNVVRMLEAVIDRVAVGVSIVVGTRRLALAVQPFAVSCTDGVPISYGYSIGMAPDIVFQRDGAISTLGANESYQFYTEASTGTGFTPRLKIVTASAPTNQTAGPGGASTDGTAEKYFTLASAAANNTVNVRVTGIIRSVFYNPNYNPGGPPIYDDNAYSDGYMTLAVFGYSGGAWSQIGTLDVFPFYRDSSSPPGTYDDSYDTGLNSFPVTPTTTRVGVAVQYESYPQSNIQDLRLAYQTAGASGTRSATPNGELTTAMIYPKNAL